MDALLASVDEELTRLIAALQNVFPEEPVQKEEADASTLTSEAASELLVALEQQKPAWEELSQTLSINDIEDFANQIQELGQTYEYTALTQWAKKLSEQAAMFDLDNMEKSLEHFPGCIETLQRMVKQ